MRARLALLNAAHDGAGSRRNFRRELDADLVEFDATAGELPAEFAFDGVVVTGSASSVYDDEEWIAALNEWLAEADERDLPILGVCYGHQALAVALGGRVEYMGEYEIGYRTVERTGDADDPAEDVLAGLDEEFTVFTTHQDRVVELPPGATLLAENDYGVHAFRRGRAWGVQFHPEYDMETAERVTRGKDEHIGEDGVEAVLEGVNEENYARACEAKRLFDNFLAYVESVRADREPAW
jgi:GMP synthase (glutamine-hydrolysing)